MPPVRDEPGIDESVVDAEARVPSSRDERRGAWLRHVSDGTTIVAVLALAALAMELVFLPQDGSVVPLSPATEMSAARLSSAERTSTVPEATLDPSPPAQPVGSASPPPLQEEVKTFTEAAPPKIASQSVLRVAAAPKRPTLAKHRPQPRPLVGCGNDPAVGRFYDSEDRCLSRHSGVALRGAPGISNGGG